MNPLVVVSIDLHAGVIGVEDDEGCSCEVQVILLHEVLGGLEGSPPVGHLGAAGVRGAALLPVVQLPGLLKHEETVSKKGRFFMSCNITRT